MGDRVLKVVEQASLVAFLIGAVALCLVEAIVFCDVAGRFLLRSPLTGASEVSEYLLVAIAYLSLGYALIRGDHVRVELFGRYLPRVVRDGLYVLAMAMALAFFVIMTVQIGQRAYRDWTENILLSASVVRMPIWWKGVVAAAGTGLLSLCVLAEIARGMVGGATGGDAQPEESGTGR